jgi:hypothetical protein
LLALTTRGLLSQKTVKGTQARHFGAEWAPGHDDGRALIGAGTPLGQLQHTFAANRFFAAAHAGHGGTTLAMFTEVVCAYKTLCVFFVITNLVVCGRGRGDGELDDGLLGGLHEQCLH